MIPVYLHCDSCRQMHNADDIYEFQGNVMHPCGGGYVGQNIFTDDMEDDRNNSSRAENSRGVGIVRSMDNTIRIYALRYCRQCCFKIFSMEKL